VGQIVIRTCEKIPIGLFSGYYRDVEKTESCHYGGLYYTGDLAWRDEDGYYWFVGRVDDVIKSSGYRIGPFEVESALMTHPAVIECAVTGAPDEIRGQVVKATIILAPEYRPGNDELAKEIQEHVKTVTAPYKYPRIVEFVTELPKTISGKIRRVEIRERSKN
jgi:acetyl-CoA synthetase